MNRPASVVNEEAWVASCGNIATTAQAVLRGDLGIIEGARKLVHYRFDVKAEDDPDFTFFVGVDSETDDLPIGKIEKHWNQTVLKQKQEEIHRYESSIKERASKLAKI